MLLCGLHLLLCRLTAFALQSFSEMAHFYAKDSFIDDSVMSAAYNYIMRTQKENGCFRLEGAVHNYRLLVGCGGGGLPGDTLLRVCCWLIGCQYTA